MGSRLRKRVWGELAEDPRHDTRASLSAVPGVCPFTAGLRIDLSIPTGFEKETPASQFVWASHAGSSRSVKTLRILLLSN